MKFIKTQLVSASPMTRGEYNEHRGWTIPADENPNDEGYLVVDSEGYQTWCPKAKFDAVSRPVDGMTLGMAIEAMKQGKKVARKGWNGKGMYLWLLPAANVKAEWCKEEHLKALAEQNGGEFECLASIRMKTADNKVLTGWLASQTDMLADDWVIVE